MVQFLKNPFYLYIISFSLVLVTYQLGWSELYPPLGIGLIIFFISTFLLSLYLGAVIDRYLPIRYLEIKERDKPFRTTIILYVLFILEFIYNGGIPIVLTINNSGFNYKDFGIPTMHPIIATFTSFYTVYVFHLFLSTKKKIYLTVLLCLLTIPLLIINRGMLLMNLTSMLFVFLLSIKRIRIKVFLAIIIFALIILYFFGLLGNYRITKTSSNDYFLEISEANDRFVDSSVPKEFMWSYIYMSSPVANLQNNINANPAINFHVRNFVIMELLPDFISKRIAPLFGAERTGTSNITKYFIVSTVFCYSYNALGWPGIYLMFLIIAFLIVLYVILLRKDNRYYVTGIGILMTFMIYNTFDNMIYFSGVSFQLVYPLIWPTVQRFTLRKLRIN